MLIHIRELLAKSHPVHLNGVLDVDGLFRKRNDVVKAEPLQVSVSAQSRADIVEAEGELTLSAELVCSRCVSHYCQTMRFPFKEAFTQQAGKADEEEEIYFVEGDRVDLRPYLEEAVLLAVPFVPLCDPECKGLDPETGHNLNIEPSRPKAASVDPRLAVLAQLLKEPQ